VWLSATRTIARRFDRSKRLWRQAIADSSAPVFGNVPRADRQNGGMADSWFSASLRFRIVIDDGDLDFGESVVVFRAADWERAFARALAIGREMEASYENAESERVEHRLLAVRTLDQLGDELTDGREVFSTRASSARRAVVDPPRPEESEPGQSGV
jgi:hypothetical protein